MSSSKVNASDLIVGNEICPYVKVWIGLPLLRRGWFLTLRLSFTLFFFNFKLSFLYIFVFLKKKHFKINLYDIPTPYKPASNPLQTCF